jgi:hypothetical protein
MINISINDLTSVFGHPMMSEKAQAVLRSNGFEPQIKLKELKEYGSVHLVLEEHGIDLDFCSQQSFKEDYEPPKEDGEAVFRSLFVYPNGSKKYKKFNFFIGFGIDGSNIRSEALQNLGDPHVTYEDEGLVEKDIWLKSGVEIRADYASDGEKIRFWNISVPRNSNQQKNH